MNKSTEQQVGGDWMKIEPASALGFQAASRNSCLRRLRMRE